MRLTPDTVLALASTLYFKAPWQSQFHAADTAPDTFHAKSGDIEAPFMHKTLEDTYYQGDGFAAVGLRLSQGRMWLLLPDDKDEDLLENGKAMAFLQNPSDTEAFRAQIALSLPKFDVTGELDAVAGLNALGVTDIFDDSRADFSPLTEDAAALAVSSILHAARVKADEEGCEAAAYTVSIVELTAAMPDPLPQVSFRLVVADDSALPLFVGAVETPA